MSTSATIWRSERLVFKGLEPEDDDFLYEMRSDSEGFINSAPFLPGPSRKAHGTSYREYLVKAPLAVIICIPSAPPADAEEKRDEAHSKKIAENFTSSTVTSYKRPVKEILTPIGDLHLRTDDNPLKEHHRNVEIGIGIHRDYQGQGYGSEALRWVLDWAFRRANMHRVAIAAFSWNEGASRLYQKLGFTIEGRKREMFWHDGAYRDLIEMSILKHEWDALNARPSIPSKEDLSQTHIPPKDGSSTV
ncbi:acyl-CoA N-acyltransferase [Dissoconium aciculare CBS 342.82]|uniref:Acyl-CoA N-acyltransferase n=1 Tax=Dissoconium aciculare CBS 342.82 TaxID=1314786 RepID=A0A6J3MA61_9PEZI|nr:acyl-CoA N-acyltransferase [Dissoconium aciculare CBS 342.82]KAF1824738.1 acyl-CoA N-acyltransferase [Dissoconium aciculare CBS 342.82]